MTLNATKEAKNEPEEAELVKQKVKHLGEEYEAEVEHLFRSYPNVMAHSFDGVRPSKFKVKHKFELKSDQLIFQRLRCLTPFHNEAVKKEAKRMLNAGITTPVELQWTSPIVLVPKKDGSTRFCVDYRILNAVMKRDRWPVPRVDGLFDEVQGSRVFTTIELFQSYWQIKIEESCKEMTTCICKYGKYQFEVMNFGLMNSRATFQSMMDNILANT